MDYDITRLTFLADPMAYQAQTDEVCARVPAGISSAEELIGVLKESLGLPAYCDDWNVLYDVLRDWSVWRTTPQRVVVIHTDIPCLRSSRLWWVHLQSYLHTLIDSIAFLQEKNAAETNPLKHRELVVIFPAQAFEEIQAVLTHPPAWFATLGFPEYNLATELEPSWPTVLQYLKHLDGLIAEICTLSREDVGMMTVQYNKHADAYYLGYSAPNSRTEMVASLEEDLSVEEDPSTFRGISFALLSQILETFFTSGQRLSTVHWPILRRNTEMIRRHWYDRNDEEALLDLDGAMKYDTLVPGVQEAVSSGEAAFSLQYWQGVLAQTDAPLSRRLTAICIIGLSGLPEASALLRPFLHSPEKQERWVSARFCGMWGDEEALPILLSMLIDELPFSELKANHYWYEGWRGYAPKLLRKWTTPEVGERLHNSLAVWVQAEPQFDQDIEIWKSYEERACYELGYREDFAALTDLSLESEHKQELMVQMERGAKVKRLHMTAQEEYKYRVYRIEPKRK
jgi:hypothetical protein